jgi:2-polyprenyl-3-methyl-5-hydroxy-6-metoxy-1,4-benzoquinol methylase
MVDDKYSCKICNSLDITEVQVCDWLVNGDNVYTYDECARCGTLSIRNTKDAPGPEHYNSNYGSFTDEVVGSNTLRNVLRGIRNRYVLMRSNSVLAHIFNYIKPLPFEFTALSKYANSKSSIVDVGCGSGKYLRELSAAGYKNLSGIDPFLGKEEDVISGISIRKKKIEEVSERFDIIISHHSLEHSEDPILMLMAIAKNLNNNGYAIITVPVLGKLYQEYKEYAYIIQAPQHTFLFTVYGLIYIAHVAGLELVEMRRGKEFESEWVDISNNWKSRGSERRQKSIDCKVSKLDGPGDNVTFVFKRKIVLKDGFLDD